MATMITLPNYAVAMLEGFDDGMSSASVRRTQMERGIPKQTILNSQILRDINVTFYFASNAHAQQFIDWYLNTVKRISFFSMKHPLFKRTVEVRFVGGEIGRMVPLIGQYAKSKCTCKLEYLQ